MELIRSFRHAGFWANLTWVSALGFSIFQASPALAKSYAAQMKSFAALKKEMLKQQSNEAPFEPASKTGKYQVCTITLGSDNEKKAFESKLGHTDFNFTELKPAENDPAYREGDESWFDDRCADSNLQCDVVIISGHFAGKFFGEKSKYELSMDKMEDQSCKKTCPGILSHPKAVFLFGCNTLASRDPRTEDDYKKALLSHGYPEDDAEELSEDMHGPIGMKYLDRTRSAFSTDDVSLPPPELYGSDGRDGLGSQVSSSLNQYLDQKIAKPGGYAGWLDSQMFQKTSDSQRGKDPDSDYSSAMRAFNSAQCAGLNPSEPDYQFHQLVCDMRDKGKTMATRLGKAYDLLKLPDSDKALEYLPTVADFIAMAAEAPKFDDQGLRAKIMSDPQVKKNIEQAIASTKTKSTRLRLLKLAYILKIRPDREALRAEATAMAAKILAPPYSIYSVTSADGLSASATLRSDTDLLDHQALAAKLDPLIFQSSEGLSMLKTLGLNQVESVRQTALNTLLKNHASKIDANAPALIELMENPSESSSSSGSGGLSDIDRKIHDQVYEIATQVDPSKSEEKAALFESALEFISVSRGDLPKPLLVALKNQLSNPSERELILKSLDAHGLSDEQRALLK